MIRVNVGSSLLSHREKMKVMNDRQHMRHDVSGKDRQNHEESMQHRRHLLVEILRSDTQKARKIVSACDPAQTLDKSCGEIEILIRGLLLVWCRALLTVIKCISLAWMVNILGFVMPNDPVPLRQPTKES